MRKKKAKQENEKPNFISHIGPKTDIDIVLFKLQSILVLSIFNSNIIRISISPSGEFAIVKIQVMDKITVNHSMKLLNEPKYCT